MRRRQSAGLFLVINVVVSLAVALLVVSVYFSMQENEEDNRARPTFMMVVTATPNPNQPLSADQLQQTLDTDRLTATAIAQTATSYAAINPAGSGEIASVPNPDSSSTGDAQGTEPSIPSVPNTTNDLPTLDPAILPSLPGSLATSAGSTFSQGENSTATPADGCERYFVQAGDTASSIADRYGVTLASLMVLNKITDQTVLHVGDELLVPSETCNPDETPTPTPTLRPTFNLTIVAPTATLAPTVENAQIEIVQVLNPGDITAEQVEIRNIGGEINLGGWQLYDEDGNIYTFPPMRLVEQQIVRVLSRSASNTPGYLYWNLNSPVWEVGEVVSLEDAEGNLQAVTTVSAEIIDFSTPGGN